MATVFGVGMKGPCPICGAPEHACRGGAALPADQAATKAIGAGFFLGGTGSYPTEGRWRAREPVYGTDPRTGHSIQVYGVGNVIPLVEALRQGVARWEDLDAADMAALAAHGVTNPRLRKETAPVEAPQASPQEPAPEARPAAASDGGKGKAKGKGADRPPQDKMVRREQVVRK